jgi:hypothetical protein
VDESSYAMRDRTVSADDHAGPHLRPDPSRADTGGRGSVGSRSDSYDSLAETVNGLYKAELIYRAGAQSVSWAPEPGKRPEQARRWVDPDVVIVRDGNDDVRRVAATAYRLPGPLGGSRERAMLMPPRPPRSPEPDTGLPAAAQPPEPDRAGRSARIEPQLMASSGRTRASGRSEPRRRRRGPRGTRSRSRR